MPSPSSPALSRRELTARLRQLRQRANLTIEEVAARLFVSSAKISRMETGARPVSLRDVSGLAPIYGLTKEERERLFALARKSREPGWWQELDATHFPEFADLESAAARVYDHQVGFVPSLLQTEEYARALIIGMAPDLSDEDVQERVKTRTARQAHLLASGRPEYFALIDQAGLIRQIGGPSVMLAQLRQIRELAGVVHIELRVVPFAAGAHPALDSPFMLFTFGDEPVGDVAYTEGLRGYSYVDQEPDLERYKDASERIQEMALPEPESIALIEETILLAAGG